jgi:hypothetical protein
MADALEQLIKEQFFDSCSEEILSRVEIWLGLTGSDDMTLDERRNLVKASWIGNQKTSRSSIQALVYAYCGSSSEVHFTHEISIIANISEAESAIYIGNLEKILSSQIPAHISWEAVMNINPSSVKVGRSIVYWRYDYQLCGLNPDVSTLGVPIETDYQVDTDVLSIVYDHDNSADKEAGTVPIISTIGAVTTTDMTLVNSTDAYIYDYNNSYDKSSGTVPEISTVGVLVDASIETDGKTDDYTYESVKSGSKSSGEEDI